jgi:hypothetical protein
MRRRIIGMLMIFCMLLTIGCAAHVHTIGSGPPPTAVTEESRQWYVLWGLVPINEIDSYEMAEGAEDYEITTEITPLDFVINIFTSLVTVNSRTVKVKK